MTSCRRPPGNPYNRSRLSSLPQGASAMADNGLAMVKSAHGVKDTVDRLAAHVIAKGMKVFARIDHAQGASEVGLALRPTELLIFGNAKGGTPLMQSRQTIGIDLPLKALVWQDEVGKVWVSYNDPSWLAKRHGLGPDIDSALSAMAAGLGA